MTHRKNKKIFLKKFWKLPAHSSVADPHYLDEDPDPLFHFYAEPDQLFHFEKDLEPPFYLDADPDQPFHFDAEPDLNFLDLMRLRFLVFINVMRSAITGIRDAICVNSHTGCDLRLQTLHGTIVSLYISIVSVHGPP